jgi:hypothetical protein
MRIMFVFSHKYCFGHKIGGVVFKRKRMKKEEWGLSTWFLTSKDNLSKLR